MKKNLSGPEIFICYRREDSSGHAGRLYDILVIRVGANMVFRDVDTIRPGENFSKLIENTIVSCKFLLVIIGKNWLDSINQQRIKNPHDYIRKEIVTALLNNIIVIPVLVQGATMPEEWDLPDELKPLATIHAMEMRDSHWNNDFEELMKELSYDLVVEPIKPPPNNTFPWKLVQKLIGISLLFASFLFFFFRIDIIKRILYSDKMPPVQELFFPFFLLIISLFILNYKLK